MPRQRAKCTDPGAWNVRGDRIVHRFGTRGDTVSTSRERIPVIGTDRQALQQPSTLPGHRTTDTPEGLV